MSELNDFIKLIEEIESILDSYDPGELSPDKIIGEIFKERAKQRPIMEKAVQLATEGLEKYPFNAVLLRMRAAARCRIVTPEGEFPELELAEQDLRTILEFDPDNLKTGFELLDMLFTFSGLEEQFQQLDPVLLLKHIRGAQTAVVALSQNTSSHTPSSITFDRLQIMPYDRSGRRVASRRNRSLFCDISFIFLIKDRI